MIFPSHVLGDTRLGRCLLVGGSPPLMEKLSALRPGGPIATQPNFAAPGPFETIDVLGPG